MPATNLKHLARFLLLPAIATLVVVVLFMRPPRDTMPRAMDGGEVVQLVRKDTFIHRVMAAFGGPSGTMWYTPAGPRLSLRLRASHLPPARRYILELDVDSTIYAVASYQTDAAGRITSDTTLTEFAEGVCVGPNYHAPRPLQGTHTIRFWLKRDGNPPSGLQVAPVAVPGGWPATTLPCRGNGDGDYRYVLLENAPAHFTGRAPGGT